MAESLTNFGFFNGVSLGSVGGSLSVAATRAGVNGYVYVDTLVTLAANTSISCNLVYAGGRITTGSFNFTLTGVLYAGSNDQVFDLAGSGVITLGQKEVWGPWFGLVSDGNINTNGFLRAIASIRTNGTTIFNGLDGNITCYASGKLRLPGGIFRIAPDQLIQSDNGLIIEGEGYRGFTNAQFGATTLMISGTSSAFGLKFYGNGARSCTITNLDLCYETSGFTGSLLSFIGVPGATISHVYLGTYGRTAPTRLTSADAILQTAYGEFFSARDCIFNGADKGFYQNDDLTIAALDFGGSNFLFENCTFYDFVTTQCYKSGTKNMTGLTFVNCAWNPINIPPVRAVNLTNIYGIQIIGGLTAVSVGSFPSVEWINLANVHGSISGVQISTGAPAGSLAGNIDISDCFLAATAGFTLKNGVITSKGNEVATGSLFIINPTTSLVLDLGPDSATSGASNSYIINESAFNSGRINYNTDLDGSSGKITGSSTRISVINLDSKEFTVSTTPYSVSIYDTGRIIIATGAADQVFTLPSCRSGYQFTFVKIGSHKLDIVPTGAEKFYWGSGAVKSQLEVAASDIGAQVTVKGFANSWLVTSVSGTWTAT